MTPTPKVGPKVKNPSHDIVLEDGRENIGLLFDKGPRALSIVPQTPSTLFVTGGGAEYGNADPSMSNVEQRTWTGGRGQENFSDDETRYFDGTCWTLTPNHLLSGIFWNKTGGTRLQQWYESINKDFIALIGALRFSACPFSPPTFAADYACLWVRRVGSPGTLTVELRNYSGGAPGTTVHASATKTVSDITDTPVAWIKFDWSSTYALSSGTTYALVAYGASTDNAVNHWEIAAGVEDTAGFSSSNGTAWTSGKPAFDNRVVPADIDRKLIPFMLDGALYVVSSPASGGAPNLYMFGTRGKATSATSTTLVDTNTTFNSVLFATADNIIKIINGTGAGQARKISSQGTNTVNVTPAWSITPDSTSEYVNYSTLDFTEITGHGLTVPVTSVCVVGGLPGIAYFAQGTTTMRAMRFNASASPPAHGFQADATTDVTLLHTFYDEASKAVQVWGAHNNQLQRAAATTWGSTLSFGTAITAGSAQYKITGLEDHDGKLYVGKEDSLWTVENDVPHRENMGLDSSPSPTNCQAMQSHGLFLYFNFMHNLEQLFGKTLSDIKTGGGQGLPAGRTGIISAMTSAFDWLFVAVDAGTAGTSSVLCWNGQGWHEIFRAPEVGQRIQSLFWQAEQLTRPRLWIGINGEMYTVDFPRDTLNPLNDSSLLYQGESALITSVFDLHRVRLPKFFKELAIISKNLATGIEIRCDYQVDGAIGGTTWTPIGTALSSPEDVLPIQVGEARQMRLRLRLITNSATTPVDIRATVLELFARTMVKYQYAMRVRVASGQMDNLGRPDNPPDDTLSFLMQRAGSGRRVQMKSWMKSMHNRDVIVEPPQVSVQFNDPDREEWGGTMLVTLRDV